MELMDTSSTVCCFTGHRDIEPRHMTDLADRLEDTICMLYDRGIRCFRCGGAKGFDTAAALKVLELREKSCPCAELELILPYEDQHEGWSPYNKRVFEYVRDRADRIICISSKYSLEAIFERNRRLVDGASVCVSYHSGKANGGTAYTVAYAARKGLEIINLY